MTAHVCHLTDWIDERVLDMEHISRPRTANVCFRNTGSVVTLVI